MSDGVREQSFLIHLTVNGTDCGVWDSWAGGDKDTASVKYRSGGESEEESLGGGTTFSDLTLGRNYRLSRDRPLIGFLLDQCGQGTAIATKQPLDRKYNAYGNPIIATGMLKTFTDPKVDSNSNNAAIVTVVIEPNSITAA